MVAGSAAELGELFAVRVERLTRRERRGEIHVLETDPHDPHAVVTGDLELGAVVLDESERWQTGGSETLDRQLSMTLDLELHDLLHLARKNARRATRSAQSASVTYLSAMTDFLSVRLVEPTLDRVPVRLDHPNTRDKHLLAHQDLLTRMGGVEPPAFR